MKKLNLFIASIFLFTGLTVHAQFKDMFDFNGTNGGSPYGSLTYSGHKFYGMTSVGGCGELFSIDTNGTNYKIVHTFNCLAGWDPLGSLTLSGSQLFGMTEQAGANGWGIVFSVDTNGSCFKVLDVFNNGGYPNGSLILSNSTLFGMSSEYGAGMSCQFGNVFRIDTDGTHYVDLREFKTTDGWLPRGDLLLSGSRLFGMTQWGGAKALACYNGSYGNIFCMDSNGTGYKDLFDFNSINGANPEGNLIMTGYKLYGMAFQGGAYDSGCIFSIDSNGTAYKDLHDFKTKDGAKPYGSLTRTGNIFYGMTTMGGAFGDGCIFSIDTDGTNYQDIHDFNGTKGMNPQGNITVVGNGLYGMTLSGGANNDGIIFGLGVSAPLATYQPVSYWGESRLFPNPNKGLFTIALPSNVRKAQIEVYNSLGERVYVTTVNSNTIALDVRNNSSGIYLYRALDQMGNQISEGKFVMQK